MPINNKVTLIGNLGDNPKTHTAKAGHEFVTFSLATNRYKKMQMVQKTPKLLGMIV